MAKDPVGDYVGIVGIFSGMMLVGVFSMIVIRPFLVAFLRFVWEMFEDVVCCSFQIFVGVA